MRLLKPTSLALAFGLLAPAAMAETFVGYGTVDGWNVYIDTEKKSCVIETVDAAEPVAVLGAKGERARHGISQEQ